jgi:hypothetical protein
MASVARLAKLALATVAGALYVWFASVRNLPEVRRRKAARRRR